MAVVAVLLAVLLMVHVSRAVANWMVGGGWTWPSSRELFPSTLGVLRGDAIAGLATAPHEHAGEGLLWTLVVMGQLVWVIGVIWGVAMWWTRWGPGAIAGTASVAQAREVLGRRRLREDAKVIRPDLYGKKRFQR
ncbi:hypothetical protein ON003_00510 [Janibacter hoylei]|uniref:hypothetical protein n=1 Tax=Janibacter hoylei TaxID=364298 RepID=UPI002238ACB0|nr:hypothetical protein [Janibacter hoylei]MCW4600265.1 hypothetical protein [Janibacter hoylei]